MLAATILGLAAMATVTSPAAAGPLKPCAGTTQKCYHAILQAIGTPVVGRSAQYQLTLYNDAPKTTTIQLGSANLTPPSPFTLNSTAQPTPAGTATIVSNVLQLRQLAVQPGGSASVKFYATSSQAGTFTWTVEAHQSNDFNPLVSSNMLTLDTANSKLTTGVTTYTDITAFIDGTKGGDVKNGTPGVDPATGTTPGTTDVIVDMHFPAQPGASSGYQELTRLDPSTAGNFCGVGPCTFVWNAYTFLSGYTDTNNAITITFVCDTTLCSGTGTPTVWEKGSGLKLPVCGLGIHPCVAATTQLSGGQNEGDWEIVTDWLSGDPVPGVCFKVCV
jgi:hypothetical protein